MKISDLQFSYPDELVGTSPQRPSRVMYVDSIPMELSLSELLQKIPANDVLVINNTKVLKRRVFAGDIEVLFLNSKSDLTWEVLFPSKKYSVGEEIELPGEVKMKLLQKGRPQRVQTSEVLNEAYFEKYAELPLPPYIQRVRGERHTQAADTDWYQTAWAEISGSLASPTASLHFTERDLQGLRNRGVTVVELTLHVGLGTFLPVTTEDLDLHQMHQEQVQIPAETWQTIIKAKKQNAKIWAMGTTVTRALESAEKGFFSKSSEGDWIGSTDLLIQPGFEWRVIDRLLTNFHQPESTLLALVSAFSDLKTVKECYAWAIERKFRLFSYGDLTVWIK